MNRLARLPAGAEPLTHLMRMFLLARFRLSLPLLALCVVPGLHLQAQSNVDPGPFYGFWQLQEPAGDQCVVNIKRGGRASSFFIGSASSKLTRGEWEIEGDRLVLTWESGYRDVFRNWGDGTLDRKAYRPDQSLDGPAAYETRAVRIDPRLPGSLVIPGERPDSSAPGSPSAPREPTVTTGSGAAPSVPMRNPFIGYWMVEQSPGRLFGLLGSAEDRFYLFLDRNGHASVALRNWDGNNAERGRWEFVNGRAQITWPTGRKDALMKEPNGTFRLLSFRRRDDFSARPDERREARQSTATEAAQYFNSGDVRLLTMTDIRGVWAPADPTFDDQRRIHIQGWGNARMETEDSGEVLKRGTWKLFNDHVVVTWEDGARDVLRNNLVFWTQERFGIGEPISGTPAHSVRVTKVSSGGLGL
jgi:hypothetical protein